MKANFKHLNSDVISEEELSEHAAWLAEYDHHGRGDIGNRVPPEGYEAYVCVDVVGSEFKWMNETFSKEKFTWYLWFESVFLVEKEMVPFLTLRWS